MTANDRDAVHRTARRTDYLGDGIAEDELAATPLEQVQRWLDAAETRQAERGDVPEPTAMSVATVDRTGMPNVRTVLMRFLDGRGPGFVTGLTSAKAAEIETTGTIAASLTWPSLYRAVRFRGHAVPLDRDEVVDYFVSRPWGSRISAWASDQSRGVASRAALEAAYARFAERYPDTGSPDDVPVPDDWGGWRVACREVELWAGRRNRLHDRLVYARVTSGGLDEARAWAVHRRQP
ncbi:pyridoxine/pyridoxamine 5'-phosphate oxidase [Paraoerskovia sediminicola]|uniref:Pyridoxamine 5'-phosphate oxidase n=1 Tax=Paraoerskovia sediminicola TaxID=1138587 RepID=A0ABN6XE88_9CELL|nr:pyridoxamine 5'-phosphate oxidase [Paraoerskovia sediminicola]BDZ41896.1 pyridoxine/pyridoxamine 5'-phosphate oxidase [Paraoerskovia sediminicola]